MREVYLGIRLAIHLIGEMYRRFLCLLQELPVPGEYAVPKQCRRR